MSTLNSHIIESALSARTLDDARHVQSLIERAIGSRHERPIGDRWNNQGLLTASGTSYDNKVLEVGTNMHDAVIELFARMKYGAIGNVPFATPQEAAESLLSDLDRKARASLSSVTLDASDSTGSKKKITVVFRDRGCGMTPSAVPQSIFHIGASHKDGVDWLQGNFGLGGATTYRNAEAVVVVTRRHEALLGSDDEDRIAVAVVEWGRQRTTVNASYLVISSWEDDPTRAIPFSAPASDFPSFDFGSHIALIGYGTEGLARRSGDERSFDTVFNTRLYRPVLPISYQNNLVRDRVEILDGLERRLNDNPGSPEFEGSETLPLTVDGRTYQLPIRFRLFAKPGTPGERRKFVAHGHAVIITSNGQVHAHWDPQEFKYRTKLNKLYDRILVVVESDALPIEVRTSLFTADRAQLVRTDPTIRLEKELAAFLNDWPKLLDANNTLIREAIRGDNNDRPTIQIAEKIARALKVRGFSFGSGSSGTGGEGRNPKPPNPTPPEDLYEDPTHFEGPVHVEAQLGKARGVFFKLNAKDGFLGPDRRGQLQVICDHPDIEADAITVGELRSGRVRVSVAIPESALLETFELYAVIEGWQKSSGGIGPKFEWSTKVELIDEQRPKKERPRTGTGQEQGGAKDGGLVALIWKTEDEVDDWNASTVGDIEMVPASVLAATRDEYKELAKIDGEIPTIVLNRTYTPLKDYVAARAAELTDEGKEQSRERYAVGVGVSLLLLYQQSEVGKKKGQPVEEEILKAAGRAAARGVLSVLPEYDRLAKELED